ncbi:probable LRR receptor-like serine/threonine-protein kinase At3g47570 [Juglans microcarpa x Juglans regia]|uniref:probable LRR receptor-like serine/threonine-protein kinase At3g47570 n=1 Tax=Juglans microcarpa x Juglans regia TaxID=2249226 RepID=UPI001B7F3A4E|nr:probable LRR receptor-like serine/threonine-protein kinase At3g47570 [Juglans microcarpa x Juglans regia]
MVLIGNLFPLLLLGFLFVQYSCMFQLIQSLSNFTDQSALIAFRSRISSSPNETLLATNWSTAPNSICNWIGVSCNRRRQRVTALHHSYMGLHGTISPHIGNLSFLVSLDLSNNSFFGFIPQEISRLHRLRILLLDSNQLEGSIPPTIQNCRKLLKVSFGMNHLIGTIPSSLGNLSTLKVLDLQDNSLTGPLPLVIFNISSLNVFAVTSNHVLGALPNDLCSHCPNLRGLYFSYNKFGGQLHSQFNNCGELVILSLSFNKFDGSISKALIGSLQKLEVLYLGTNSFTGIIPSTICNLSRLQEFGIEQNHIQGSIPTDLWHLSKLTSLYLGRNNFKGAVPQKVFNLSSLKLISFQENSLSGYLPSLDSGQSCPNLEIIALGINKLSGHIPSYLSNCSNLIVVDFAGNFFFGPIPKSLGNLNYLRQLSLGGNQLIGGVARDQEPNFISSLSNCRSLRDLDISYNPLDIIIPDSIQNFSASIQIFVANNCQIRGHIPMGLSFLKGLSWLDLGGNNLIGNIPFTFGGLERLQRLHLYSNRIEGLIPQEICQLRNLGELDLSINRISGVIPNCISNLNLLVQLNLSFNKLKSSIPLNIWGLENLFFLDLSSNSLSEHLFSNMTKLDTLEYLNLSRNEITGEIPSIIGSFESLRYLDFSNNSFQGGILQSFGNLKGLDILYLSYNNLSGVIPKSLEALPYLKYLNLSFNKIVGEIPSGGPFVNLTAESFSRNSALCGNPILGVPPCPTIPTYQQSKMKNILIKCILPVIASIITVVMLVYLLRRLRKSNMEIPTSLNAFPALEHRMISYQELCQGTNNFCESNLLGVGGFGSVYKGILSDRTIVAVKVLSLQLSGAFKSFDAECKVLCTIRHRNLVKVITTCTNPEFRALVLEYMSNGNLEKWLYSHNYCLDLLQRINILVDVASALDYLHHGQTESILHCDLKPTNILLDEGMVGHVGDFGIAKILVKNKDATYTKTLGTIGYIAPEYGFEGKVSIKTDVYSYGITLLEMITRKKPTDDMFAGDFTLRQLVNASIPDRMMEVVDEGLLRIEDGRDTIALQSILSSILDLGLRCSEELPDTRMDIKYVLVKLNKIKSTFFENRNRVTRHT